ncbi:DUF559 domain-containing protein [Staphylococcus simulans]|uniref:DUF559 domain-containing protein n=1 Tax=Staphylococcus simulans TaxID=1286 RepID=UPI000F71AAEE|nr:DUF559 domain-containing protein [Staphylococcus simulans]VED60436.1 Uncharacterised protein [Staphylococcus simulans]
MRLLEEEDVLKKSKEDVKKLIEDIEKLMFNDLIYTNVFYGTTILDKCQSPIEQLYILYLNYYVNSGTDFKINILPQFVINTRGGKYKVDFHVRVSQSFVITNDSGTKYFERSTSLCIECDGHDFHEKTKQQVQKDKQRERDIISNGYTIIRFTGSEIFNSPIKCARETTRILEEMIERKGFKKIDVD